MQHPYDGRLDVERSEMASVSYPVEKHKWVPGVLSHFIYHRFVKQKQCMWCVDDGESNDEFLFQTIVSVPVVTKMLRSMYQSIFRECSSSNSAVHQKGRMSEEQCDCILQLHEKTHLGKPKKNSDQMFIDVLSLLEIDYRQVLRRLNQIGSGNMDENYYSVVERLLSLPKRVGLYSPVVCIKTGFGVLRYRYMKWKTLMTGTLEEKQEMFKENDRPFQLEDVSFLLYCLHISGELALTPDCNLFLWGEAMNKNSILYLDREKHSQENIESKVCEGVKELEALFEITKDTKCTALTTEEQCNPLI